LCHGADSAVPHIDVCGIVSMKLMWNTVWNMIWFVICMALLVSVTILCVIVDLIVTVIDFFKKLFTKNIQHN
jgi:cytochrome c biogenesis protein ResB